MHRLRAISLLGLAAALILGACGDPEAPDKFAGTWRFTLDTFTESYAFGADRTFTFERMSPSRATRVTGTFMAIGDRLYLDGTDQAGTRIVQEMTYYINDVGLAFGLLPEGNHQGPVGVWSGGTRIEEYEPGSSSISDLFDEQARLELRADGSARATVSTSEPPDLGVGTWSIYGNLEYEARFPTPDPNGYIVISVQLFANSIMTQRVYSRVR